MALDHVVPQLNVGDGDYPLSAPDRFASALQQFVWSCRQRFDGDAWSASESHASCLSLSLERVPPSPSLSPHAAQTLRSLQEVLSASRGSECDARTDPVTEAGLYLMRLTRLLEQQTLARVQNDVAQCLRDSASASMGGSPPTRALEAAQNGGDAPCLDRRDASGGSNTVHSRGRRYTRPEASSTSLSSPSPSVVFDTDAIRTPRAERFSGEASSPMWRYHADLTLQLQQCMLRCLCLLDATLAENSADDGGLRGILTHSRAAQLQSIFLDGIHEALTDTQTRWAINATAAGAAEAMKEIAAAVKRLQQAASAQRQQQQGATAPQLRVYELSPTEPLRCSPPPFASRKQSPSALFHSSEGGGDCSAASGTRSDIERCLGVAGCDYASKLVAQQLWCAQKTLSQRFPSYAATWDLLDRARSLAASTRSPTPTVPRSDATEHYIAATSFERPASSPSSSPERAHRHDGGTPPPCVTATQTKSERPCGTSTLTSPPLRSLTYSSEERSMTPKETVTNLTETTLSPSRRPTASPPMPHGTRTGLRLLPVARCALWDSFLASRGVPAASTLSAIEELAAEADLLQVRQTPGGEPPRLSCQPQLLQPRDLNGSHGKQSFSRRRKTYSIETEHCLENRCPATTAKRHHARSK